MRTLIILLSIRTQFHLANVNFAFSKCGLKFERNQSDLIADNSSLVLGNMEVWSIYLLSDLKCYFILFLMLLVRFLKNSL